MQHFKWIKSIPLTISQTLNGISRGQVRALKGIFRFLAVMLIFTVVAQGTAGATVAKVSLTTPHQGDVLQSFITPAIVESSENTGISLLSGLTLSTM